MAEAVTMELAKLAPMFTFQNVMQGLAVAVFVAIVIVKLRAPKLKLPPGPIALPVVGNWLQVSSVQNRSEIIRNLARFLFSSSKLHLV